MANIYDVVQRTIGRLEGMAAICEKDQMADSLLAWAEELHVALQGSDDDLMYAQEQDSETNEEWREKLFNNNNNVNQET